MRQIAVTLAFAVLSLAFAPAPFPRAELSESRRALRCLEGRLRSLAVTWQRDSERDGMVWVSYSAPSRSEPGGLSHGFAVGADLAAALRALADWAEAQEKAER